MKSATKIKKQAGRKTNSGLAATIRDSANSENWKNVAHILSMPRRSRVEFNLDEIEAEAKDGENIIIPGKVLSRGEVKKKVKIIALNFSEKAKEKLSKNKINFSTIGEEIKKNPDAKGLRILR